MGYAYEEAESVYKGKRWGRLVIDRVSRLERIAGEDIACAVSSKKICSLLGACKTRAEANRLARYIFEFASITGERRAVESAVKTISIIYGRLPEQKRSRAIRIVRSDARTQFGWLDNIGNPIAVWDDYGGYISPGEARDISSARFCDWMAYNRKYFARGTMPPGKHEFY